MCSLGKFVFFLTLARFQLLLLYHFFPERRRLVKDKQGYDDHCNQDWGEEDHEEDIGGVRERLGQRLLSWDHVGQVQHVAQSPPGVTATDLAHEINVLPGTGCEIIAFQKEGQDVGAWKAVFTQVLFLYSNKRCLYLLPGPRAEIYHRLHRLFWRASWCQV